MSSVVPNTVLRRILLDYLKKSAAEAHRILLETYGHHGIPDTTCGDWFRRLKNIHFEIEDKERKSLKTRNWKLY